MPGRVLFTLSDWGAFRNSLHGGGGAPSRSRVHAISGQCGHAGDARTQRRVKLQVPPDDPDVTGMEYEQHTPQGPAKYGPGATLMVSPGEAAHLVGLGCASYVDEA